MNPVACYLSSVSGLTRTITVCALVLLTPVAHAEEGAKARHCDKADVRLVRISVDSSREILLSTTPQIFEKTPGQTSESTSNVVGKAVAVIAVGPVLDSMDSHKIETDLECTTNGFALTATITRSADYHGAVQKSMLWRPRIELAVILKKPEVVVKTIWKIRLTTSVELDHAQTPPYAEQNYPMTAVKTLQ